VTPWILSLVLITPTDTASRSAASRPKATLALRVIFNTLIHGFCPLSAATVGLWELKAMSVLADPRFSADHGQVGSWPASTGQPEIVCFCGCAQ